MPPRDEALDKHARLAARAAARRATTPRAGRAPARRTTYAALLAATGLLSDGDAVPRPRDAEAIWADYLTDRRARAVRAPDVVDGRARGVCELTSYPVRRGSRQRPPSPGRRAPSPGGCTARRAGRARRCPRQFTQQTPNPEPRQRRGKSRLPRARSYLLAKPATSAGKTASPSPRHRRLVRRAGPAGGRAGSPRSVSAGNGAHGGRRPQLERSPQVALPRPMRRRTRRAPPRRTKPQS